MLDDLSNVTHAQVTGVSGTIGETRSYGQVNAISLASGSLYNGSSTVYAMTNEVVLQLSTNVGGTITELSTGTVSGTISLIAQGF